SPVAIRDRSSVMLHLGASETTARVILQGESIAPGTHGFVELRTSEPIVAAFGQRVILRRLSPAVTIGGGTILDPGIEPRRRLPDAAKRGAELDAADDLGRLALYLFDRDEVDRSPISVAWKVGVPADRYSKSIEELIRRETLIRIGDGEPARFVHRD